ncbi:hypothetical protein DPMN_147045 [Dreissena polymorpha]|uniref:Uncharacterized protein n=1 Tax=Dreissena polymorpha TaxID=45954 RepID=A0A9D4F939_DREPO|nr:hypothetical protein DPMN_147045 [Dreissena polymorpha]
MGLMPYAASARKYGNFFRRLCLSSEYRHPLIRTSSPACFADFQNLEESQSGMWFHFIAGRETGAAESATAFIFRKHDGSECHKEAVERLVTLPATTRDGHAKKKAANRTQLLKILRSIRFLARQGIALRKPYAAYKTPRGDGQLTTQVETYQVAVWDKDVKTIMDIVTFFRDLREVLLRPETP